MITEDNRSAIEIWPPPYTIRRSGKARRLFLQISPSNGLEIVVPHQRKRINIEAILKEKRAWIEKILKKYSISHPVHPLLFAPERPELIECQAISETWKIVYQPLTTVSRVTLSTFHYDKTILLKGNTDNPLACQKLLIKWLIKQAKIHLISELNRLSLLTRLPFNQAIIRGQSTLWGSCNAKKTISLNYKLLFLPRILMEHVLLHELCHTKYLDHSEKFWQLFQEIEKDCMKNRKALKLAEHYLPAWLNVV